MRIEFLRGFDGRLHALQSIEWVSNVLVPIFGYNTVKIVQIRFAMPLADFFS
jgi:hypothetical protein